MRPLIGLTASGRGGEFHLSGDYCEAIAAAGGAPVLIPHVPVQPEPWLDRCDGLLLAGGGDVDPARYRGDPHDSIEGVDPRRDENELALLREALRRRLPTLAICRGIQVLNVALGGTLIADLPAAVGRAVAHRVGPRQPIPHPVRIEPDSVLAGLLECIECVPMSSHHQAIDRLGEGLVVVARAPDGVIEAVEWPGRPWLLAVQWHPELSARNDPVQQRLFNRFVQAAASGQKSP